MTSPPTPPQPTPPPLDAKGLIEQLTHEILWLNTKWNLFNGLFGRTKNQIDTMNRRTGFPFRMFQDSLLDDVLLGIARLFDNPHYQKKRVTRYNATFELAVQKLPAHVPESSKTALTDRVVALKSRFDTILLHRNRRIGHVDLAVAKKVDVLPPLSWEEIRQAVDEAKTLLNDISMTFDGKEIGFLDARDENREIDILIRILNLGNDAIDAERKARRNRWKEMTGDDDEVQDDPLNESPEL